MFKSLFAASAAIALFAVSPVQASETIGESIELASAVTADQAGRIVMQDGQAIGTLTEVSEEDNLAVIALMDGSQKEVSLSDLAISEDGSVELVAYADTQEDTTTYE